MKPVKEGSDERKDMGEIWDAPYETEIRIRAGYLGYN